MLRKISGPSKKRVTGDLRKLHNEELCPLAKYYSGDDIREHEISRACDTNRYVRKYIQTTGAET
jgi:hypothetical protein